MVSDRKKLGGPRPVVVPRFGARLKALRKAVKIGNKARSQEYVTNRLAARYGLPLDPKREVWRLSVGERQRIEIVRALMQNPKLLILDEPTAVLTPQEAEVLFETLRGMAADGRTVIFISHKLHEVKAVADRVTVLRGGRSIGTGAFQGLLGRLSKQIAEKPLVSGFFRCGQ